MTGAGEAPATLPPRTVRIGVVGLGYVGLPVAAAFGRLHPTVGFDIDPARIAALERGADGAGQVGPGELAEARHLTFTADPAALAACTVFVVTVPTPVDRYRRPDLTALLRASETVGAALSRGDTVVYESTVYPGATEEDCAPVLERVSGLARDRDFFLGYSPERINPGDPAHGLADVVKVTSGSTPEAAAFVDALYRGIVPAGTHRAPSIRVAEAAKVIENTQRDLNIALVNELALIFHRLGIDTLDVLEAAGTKWNFLPFRPGLVGGHCIGVDPYYLTHRAQAAGYHPEIVLAGRRINDSVGTYVARRLVRGMVRRGTRVLGARVLVMGLTFKEDCPDLRNTRVVDLVAELESCGARVDVWDPVADPGDALREHGIALAEPEEGAYLGIVLAVAHRAFAGMTEEAVRALCAPGAVVSDARGALPRAVVDQRL